MTRLPPSGPLNDAGFDRLRRIVRRESGIVVPEIRRPDVDAAVRLLLRQEGSSDLGLILDLLERPDEGRRLRADLVNAITINETYFYRDSGQFEAIETEILPEILRRRHLTRSLRIWSAGCSTGEEAYSLAIALDRVLPRDAGWTARIVATDINPRALETARVGSFGEWSFRQTPPWLKANYFRKVGDRYEILPRIRERILFTEWNLNETASWPHSLREFDLILCRNVLIYFDNEVVREVSLRFRESLAEGGWLVVGPAELTILDRVPFDVVELRGGIVYRRTGSVALAEPPATAGHSWMRVTPPGPAVPIAPTPVSTPGRAPVTRESVAQRLSVGDRTAALEEFGKLVDVPGTSPRLAYWVALALADRAAWDLALPWSKTATIREPLAADAHYLRGLILSEVGQVDEALDAYRRCVFANSEHVLGHLALADLYRSLNQPRRERASMDCVERWLSGRALTDPVPDSDGLTVGKIQQRIATRRRA